MLQSTHFDPVLGLDTHIVGIPAPPAPLPIPTPIPMPFVGMVFDPAGVMIGAAIGMATGGGPNLVLVNCIPATNCGTGVTNKLTMPHLPAPGVAFIPPPAPANDALLFFGSLNVTFGGSLGVRLGDVALSCNDPVRLPVSMVLAIPKGPLVLNMPAMVPDMKAIAMAIAMKVLGALLKKGAALFRQFRQRSAFFQRLASRLGGCEAPAGAGRFRQMWSRAVRSITGHPVDVVTGNLFTSAIDVHLPGPMPLTIERVYESAGSDKATALGWGWSHSLDEALWMERGRAVVRCGDGREVEFGLWDLPNRTMRPGDQLERVIHRMKLRCVSRERYEVEQSDGRVHEFAFVRGGDPAVARLLRIRSRDGHHAIDLTYDDRGRLARVRDSAGRLLNFKHDVRGRLVALELPNPNGAGWYPHRRYIHDERGDLIEVQDAVGQSWRFQYRTHLLVQETDRSGFSFYFQYDGIGALARCVRTWGDAAVHDHVITYDQANRKTLVEDSLGAVTLYKFNERNQVVERLNALGQTTKFDYDPDTGGRILEEDPTGAATTRRFDRRGNLLEIKRPGDAVTRFFYDERDRPVRAVDPLGGNWSWRYDAGGLMTERVLPNGETTTFVWERGLLKRSVDAAGQATAIHYDEHKSVVEMVFPGQRTERFAYDGLGRILETVDARGGVTRSRYDPEGRILETRRPGGDVQSVVYNASGAAVEVRNANRSVRLRYEAFHWLAQREEGGLTRTFHHDSEGRLTGMTNEANERYTFALDAVGRVQREIGFDGRIRSFVRDKRGKVVKTILPSGRQRVTEYDGQGRVVRSENDDGTFAAFLYRADGKMIEAENQSAKVVMERDELGRIVREVVGGQEVRSRYLFGDVRGELHSSLGARAVARPDATGQIERMHFGVAAGEPDVLFERDALGVERRMRFLNGIEVEWQRDDGGHPTARRIYRQGTPDSPGHGVSGPAGAAGAGRDEIHVETLSWRGADQIAAIIDASTGPRHYDHDPRGNLVRERRPDRLLERSVDAVGNVYRAADHGDRRYGPGGRLELAEGARFESDADGNQVRRIDPDGGAWRYHWDGHGMLAAIDHPDGGRMEFEYDAFARRIVKRRLAPGGRIERETRFVWDGHHVIHEIDGQEGVTTWHWKPGTFTPLAKEQGADIQYVTSDHLGTPTEMYDVSGRLVWRLRLDVYGEATLDVGKRSDCRWRWPGQYDDEEVSGLVYNRHRYYAADQGNYLSDDPLFLLVDTPRGYCPNPLTQYDPLGWHLANAWFTPPGGARTPVGNPDMGGANRWPNVPGSGGGDMAPSGLGRAGDSENLIMEHLEGTQAGQMEGGILEIASTRAHGSSLPPCTDCGIGMQNFADRNGVTVVYTQNGAHGPTGEPRVFHPMPPGGCV